MKLYIFNDVYILDYYCSIYEKKNLLIRVYNMLGCFWLWKLNKHKQQFKIISFKNKVKTFINYYKEKRQINAWLNCIKRGMKNLNKLSYPKLEDEYFALLDNYNYFNEINEIIKQNKIEETLITV